MNVCENRIPLFTRKVPLSNADTGTCEIIDRGGHCRTARTEKRSLDTTGRKCAYRCGSLSMARCDAPHVEPARGDTLFWAGRPTPAARSTVAPSSDCTGSIAISRGAYALAPPPADPGRTAVSCQSGCDPFLSDAQVETLVGRTGRFYLPSMREI